MSETAKIMSEPNRNHVLLNRQLRSLTNIYLMRNPINIKDLADMSQVNDQALYRFINYKKVLHRKNFYTLLAFIEQKAYVFNEEQKKILNDIIRVDD